jgi:hypothetical protein
VTGKALKPMDDEAPRLGVYFLLPGTVDGRAAPRCICRIMDRKPHLESWGPPYIMGQMNATGPKEVDWNKDTVFLMEVAAGVCTWSVNGADVGKVRFPPTAVGGRIAFAGVDGGHVWKNFKLIFKPDPAWVKQHLGGGKPAPPAAQAE